MCQTHTYQLQVVDWKQLYNLEKIMYWKKQSDVTKWCSCTWIEWDKMRQSDATNCTRTLTCPEWRAFHSIPTKWCKTEYHPRKIKHTKTHTNKINLYTITLNILNTKPNTKL